MALHMNKEMKLLSEWQKGSDISWRRDLSWICFIDILDSKRLPIIGWLDEVASLTVLVQKMSKYITPEMEVKADDQLDKWFPEYVEFEMIEG